MVVLSDVLHEPPGEERGEREFGEHHEVAALLGGLAEQYQQALHHLAVFQMRLHDFINVACIHIGVPNRLRVNHCHGSRSAAV